MVVLERAQTVVRITQLGACLVRFIRIAVVLVLGLVAALASPLRLQFKASMLLHHDPASALR